jgi:outer membrane protein assembly factor BamB
LAVSIVGVGPAAAPLCAQLFQFLRRPATKPAGAEADADEPVENTFPAPDRATLQQLSRAREALREGRYGEAIEGLSDLLAADEDHFFKPDRNAPTYRSLKSEARRLIGQMPREGRDLYEIRAGAGARAMLQQAIASGDAAALAKVSVQYFHTQAGYEATFLLGLHHLDHGSPLAGVLTLKRLLEAPEAADRFEPALSLAAAACALQAGMPDDAADTLAALRRRHPQLALTIGGREAEWFFAGEAAAWLGRLAGPLRETPAAATDQWTMHRGDPARNAAMRGGAPLFSLKWRVPLSDGSKADDVLSRLARNYREHGAIIVPSLHPLALDDLVLMRTRKTLVAVEFETGKQLWEIPVDDPLDLLDARSRTQAFRQGLAWPMQLGQRLWDDAAYGTFASDGRLVFTLEDLDVGAGNQQRANMIVFGPGGNRSEAAGHGPCNRLAAFNIATQGKLVWQLGGPGGPQALRQPDTFFLGPPLPLRGQLYVLAEVRDEIRLLALEASSGNLLWSQQLTMVEQNISQDLLRRLAGLSPSYANGILVCPTGANSVVAVDLATHALLWGYRFNPGVRGDFNRRQQIIMLQNGNYAANSPLVSRWLDSTATLCAGRALLTPPEADALFCLNLADGQPAWEPVPRGDDLYVACVHRGAIVLAGAHEVHAIRLADGKPAWNGRKVSLPDGAAVSGRGFYSGNRYYLPTSNAEVLAIDLDRGAQVQAFKSRKGDVPGNLVCYRGKIISQGLDGVDAFYQADALAEEIRQRLAANPDDAEARARHGEMLLEEGKSAEALAEFRRACELDRAGDSYGRAQGLLRDALLDGLHHDFAGYRQHTREIEQLLDGADQKAAYLRLMAEGFHGQHDGPAALDYYLKLADLDAGPWPLEAVADAEGANAPARAHRVRRDRWLQTHLEALRRDGGPQAAPEIDRALEPRLRAAVAADGPQSLRRFVECFDGQPAAAEARRELVQRLVKASRAPEKAEKGGGLLEAEMLVRSARPQGDRRAAAAALLDLADLFSQAERREAEAACYRALAEQYGDVVCRNGKTGRQWVAELPADAPVRRELRPRPAWPSGDVEIKQGGAAGSRGFVYGRFAVAFQTDPGPFFADAALRFDPNPNRMALLGANDLGQPGWEVPLAEALQRTQFNPYNYNGNIAQVRAEGHLLLMTMGTRIFALDPLGIAGGSAKLLWSQDLADSDFDADADVTAANAFAMAAPFAFQQQFANGMNPVGLATSRCVAFLRFSNLVALDPLTGETLWVQEDVRAGSAVFGDDQYVFLLPPATPADYTANPYVARAPSAPAGPREALVYRASDGAFLGKRAMPPARNPDLAFMSPNPARNSFLENGTLTRGRCVLSWERDGTETELKFTDPWEQRPVWPPRKFAAGARACLVGDDAVAVLERDGHFTLLGLSDGRTIADSKLPLPAPPAAKPIADGKLPLPASPAAKPVARAGPQLQSDLTMLTVLHLDDQYFVLAHERRRPGRNNQQILNLSNMSMIAQPVQHAQLFALDGQGKPQWPAPVTIDNQQLLVNQPARLPVLVLACQTQRLDQRNDGRMLQQTAVLAIDRRSGRTVYEGHHDNPLQVFDVVGNPEQKTVELRMNRNGNASSGTVILHFTDKPVPAKAAAAQPPGRVTDALWHALQQSLGGPSNQDEDDGETPDNTPPETP